MTQRAVAVAVVAFALLAGAIPAGAHTPGEYAAWEDDWLDRVDAKGGVVSAKLLAERADMTARHPHHSSEPHIPAAIAYLAPTPLGGGTGMGSGVEQWRDLVATYFPYEQRETAMRVMACESQGDPNAYNPSGASGLFQLMTPLWSDHFGVSRADLFDPVTNVELARRVYDIQGWGAWVCK